MILAGPEASSSFHQPTSVARGKGPSGKVSQPQMISAIRPAPAKRTKQPGFMKADIYPRLVRPLQLKSCGPIRQGVARVFDLRHPRLTLCFCPNTLCVMQTVDPPINLQNWIEKNREKFKPPVSNHYLYDGRDFFVMVIKGPNARNDFHLVDSEEYFYQL